MVKYIKALLLILSATILNAQISISDSSKFKVLDGTKVLGFDVEEISNDTLKHASESKLTITVIGNVKLVGELLNTEIVQAKFSESSINDLTNEILEENEEVSDKSSVNQSDHKKEPSKKILLTKSPSSNVYFSDYLKNNLAISFFKKSFDLDANLTFIAKNYYHLTLKEYQTFPEIFFDDYIKFHYPIRSPPEHNTTVPLSIIQCTMLNNKV